MTGQQKLIHALAIALALLIIISIFCGIDGGIGTIHIVFGGEANV